MPQMNTVLIGGASTAIIWLIPAKIPPKRSPWVDQATAASMITTAVAWPTRTNVRSRVWGRIRWTMSILTSVAAEFNAPATVLINAANSPASTTPCMPGGKSSRIKTLSVESGFSPILSRNKT